MTKMLFRRTAGLGLAMCAPILLGPVMCAVATPARAADDPAPQTYALHAQATFVDQATAGFTSPYRGPNSLDPAARGRETVDVTLYAGVRPWTGGEIWINPEIDQGFGLSDTLGVAGFPSGEAYKVGKQAPYLKLARAFLRQTISLGGETSKVEADQNVLAGTTTANRLVFTVGKFSVGDVFDTNRYAHDPRSDFLNWTLIDAGTFDYAADAWGYTYGAAGEWYQGPWTLRAGVFAMSLVPNGEHLDTRVRKFQTMVEGERRYDLFGKPGSVKITTFLSRAPMGSYADALRTGLVAGTTPNVLDVRRYASHAGISFNIQQQLGDDLGLFARGGVSDGHQQAYEFTDVNRTLSLGASLAGHRWGRTDDTVAAAMVVNDISHAFRTYLGAGGLGILVGDGRLDHQGPETIMETYYSWAALKAVHITADYQFIANPAYNTNRGPVSVAALRVHVGI